jgi:hypothetical protein
LNTFYAPRLYVALTHYPVMNKNGEVIASAVTNLDIHDISRAAKTYGIDPFYVVTPLEDQKTLVSRIVSHWTNGPGAGYNASRKAALDLVRIEESLDAVITHISGFGHGRPKVVATCARRFEQSIGYDGLREKIKSGEPCLLVFGTAWGLADQLLDSADYILAPIRGNAAYNHLSVRCAAAVIFDRLLGDGTCP